ncbi:MAG: transporter substrate-binding domain-containing protein [Undibacterium sp.]|nr:transporter substrate-binding domain-containing protein [Undibacterium sp.]
MALMSGATLAAPLTFCFEDIPQRPWSQPDGSGLNIVLLKRVENLLGEQFIYISKPWKRCQEEVRMSIADGFFGAADSVERRRYSVFPMHADGSVDAAAAIYEDRFNVYIRSGGKAKWDGKKISSPQRAVVVQRGYLVATLLQEQGVAINDSVKTAAEGLAVLASGQADVAVLQGIESENLVNLDPKFKGMFVSSDLPYAVLPLYLAINKNTYLRDSKRVKAIWAAIRAERNSAGYRKLLDSAGVK